MMNNYKRQKKQIDATKNEKLLDQETFFWKIIKNLHAKNQLNI